jgi:ferrous iron transport protein B
VPGPSTIWRETHGALGQFSLKAIPIFLVVTLIASLLDWLGVVWNLAAALGSLMAFFHLPAKAALPVVLALVRKDGILLFAKPDLVEALTPLQVLTGVYLAGVLLACLVTMLTIAREQSKRFVLKLIGRQALAATVLTILLTWGGTLLSQ